MICRSATLSALVQNNAFAIYSGRRMYVVRCGNLVVEGKDEGGEGTSFIP